jgi:hypothetical protein
MEVFVYLEIYSAYLEIYDYGVLVQGVRFPASGTPTRYIVGIYHVYTMYIPRGGIYLVYTRYIHWILKKKFMHFCAMQCCKPMPWLRIISY